MKQEIIYKAILNYDYYTNGQKNILASLYQLSIDYIATIRVASLAEITGYSRHMVYKAIHQFEKDGIIEILESGHKNASLFKLNESKLQAVVEVYDRKLSVINDKKNINN